MASNVIIQCIDAKLLPQNGDYNIIIDFSQLQICTISNYLTHLMAHVLVASEYVHIQTSNQYRLTKSLCSPSDIKFANAKIAYIYYMY